MIEWPQPGQQSRASISGPAGALEVLAAAPAGAARAAAVLCHPHPQFGGSLDNKVVHTLARSCLGAGVVALRFNFRGVGKSAGEYAQGEGELDDARSLADWAADQAPDLPLLLGGFSFGAGIALRLAAERPALGLLTIALPTRYFDSGLPRPACPWFAIYGTQDEVLDASAARADLERLEKPPGMAVLEGAGHFFHGRLTELRDTIKPFLERTLDGQGSR